MLRDIDLNEISDGRLYTANDMVKADCMGCQGCASCCQGMGDSIVLDPYDMYRLCTGLKTTPAALLASSLELGVVDGLILPHLKMNGRSKSVNGLMSRIFQGTKNSYLIGTTISNRYKTML